MPGMLLMSCPFAGSFLVVADFFLRVTFLFCLAFGFGLALFIPGMLWPSCCGDTLCPTANERINTAENNRCFCFENNLFMVPLPLLTMRAFAEIQ